MNPSKSLCPGTSALALIPYARKGRVRWKAGVLFGVSAMIGSFFGGSLAQFVPGSLLLSMFAALMVVTGGAMLRPKTDYDVPENRAPLWAIVGEGVVVGAVTGLVGAGGGFLVVPALVLLGGYTMKDAIGTSLLVVSMKSFAGFFGYVSHVSIPWDVASVLAATAAIGTVAGAALVTRMSDGRLRRAFAGFVLLTGLGMLGQELLS